MPQYTVIYKCMHCNLQLRTEARISALRSSCSSALPAASARAQQLQLQLSAAAARVRARAAQQQRQQHDSYIYTRVPCSTRNESRRLQQ